jgi:hypothetical protein
MLRFALLCLTTLSCLAAQPAMAEDHAYSVGTCKPRLANFPTISVAVVSVPPGSTIFVCPGTYPGQVTISQPLTLQGVASGGQDEAVVTVPGGSVLSANATSIFGEPVAAQVLVQTPGPVNIVNLSVDGTGSDMGCAGNTWVAGIFYTSGSSGVVSRARASGQMNSACGAGIWVENDGTSNQFVDIGDSSVHDVSNSGIFVEENGTAPTLTARVHGNTVNVPNGLIGIAFAPGMGTANGNDVSNAVFGMVDLGAQTSLASNNVRLSSAGILLEGGGQVVSNRVSDVGVGVLFFLDGGNLQGNRITASSQAAVEFGCHLGSARGNVISDTPLGLDQETAVFDNSNNFDNTVTISAPCATPVLAAAALRGASASTARNTDSIWQWRTPGSPAGALQ